MTHTLHRRAFLSTLSAAAASAAIARHAPPRPAAKARHHRPDAQTLPLRKSLKFGMIGVGSSLDEKFQAAKQAGFDGVELDSPNDFNTSDVLDAARSAGVLIPGVVNSRHWAKPLSHPDPAVRADMLDALKRSIEDCHAYGGSSVLLVPAVVNRDVPYEDAYKRSQEELRKALPLAEQLGVDILIENVWNNFLLSPLEAARFVDELQSPRAGWYFDVGNIVHYGWPHHWIRTLGPRIRKLDIKEFSRRKADKEGRWAGFNVDIGDPEGDCDWPAVMDALRAVPYQGGWASAEVAGGDLDRLTDIARRMDRVFAS